MLFFNFFLHHTHDLTWQKKKKMYSWTWPQNQGLYNAFLKLQTCVTWFVFGILPPSPLLCTLNSVAVLSFLFTQTVLRTDLFKTIAGSLLHCNCIHLGNIFDIVMTGLRRVDSLAARCLMSRGRNKRAMVSRQKQEYQRQSRDVNNTRQGSRSQAQAQVQSSKVGQSGVKHKDSRMNRRTLRNVTRGKQDFALGECLCAAFMWVREWGAGVVRQSEWWVNGDSCVIGVMVDGNVWVQCMMGNVVHGWCAVWVSGNQIHNRAPHLGAASRRLHKAKSRRAVERRWNRGRGRRTRSMWGQWNRSPPGQGGRDSRDVRWLWQVSGGVRWLWQVSGGVRWLWQVRRPPGRSRRDRHPPGRSRRDRRPPGRSRRDRRPPGRSRRDRRPPGRSRRDRRPPGRSRRDRRPPGRSRDPGPRLGPRGNGDTRGRESTFGFRNRGREF